ncbi:nif-specific transcriptional activator NifA [Uliginosibacterium paludis]|uniref:Nif-specific regulatory protein n=1 Tax=Uliginosibacterium paludis TaxID=1615952 RepID=A0ABV2CLI8_9RHOO
MIATAGNRASESRASLELVTVYEISKILTSSLDVSRTLRESLNVLQSLLGFRRSMVLLKEEDEDELELFVSVGLNAAEAQLARYQPGEGVIGRVFSLGTPNVIPDIASEPLFLNRTGSLDENAGGPPTAFVAVPIRTATHVIGVLTIDRKGEDSGGYARDLRLLSMVANLIGQAVTLRRIVTEDRERLILQTEHERDARNKTVFTLDNVVGASERMQQVFAEAHMVAPSRSTVLLRGESGTGKEVIARAVHELSPRANKPFVKVNCAALSETLLESELFGHEKGAFTGAAGVRKGRFEMADGGTLFMDEIGDISPAFQTKLLRVLQEREFERVGGNKPIKVDVRLICATNRNLEKMVSAGTFRSDLYFRINVISIFLPPLRERPNDIPALASHFLQRFNEENDRHIALTDAAQGVLQHCYWPGNVRELENCIERVATMTRTDRVDMHDFPCTHNRCLTQVLHFVKKDDAVAPAEAGAVGLEAPQAPAGFTPGASPATPASSAPAGSAAADGKPEGERERLIWAMEQARGVRAKAARLLNITGRQMGYALKKYDIQVRRF